MKCVVPRCPDAPVAPVKRKGKLLPPQLGLCAEHRRRYEQDYRRHFGPVIDNLQRRWRVSRKVTQERLSAVVEESAKSALFLSWQSTWVQMIDDELSNHGNAIVASGLPLSPPRVQTAAQIERAKLPESATRAGQAAIQQREAEQQLLERRLVAETEDFRRGQRQALELELKTKRETELRAAAKRAKEKSA